MAPSLATTLPPTDRTAHAGRTDALTGATQASTTPDTASAARTWARRGGGA